ncbi:MAG: archaellar assembly protein FlaJ [Chloroflexi bacterium]|nr:archaellar assembly protein FlaJ [Chloroflexota bacterium]MCI0776023.1 archaellar assembly protein FlaJ [Chloroflexota bacterium]
MALGIISRLGFGDKAKKAVEDNALSAIANRRKVDKKTLAFDLFTHISYMASMATAKASRDVMFSYAARLNLSTTPYFVDINTLVNRLKYDYSEACRAVADRTKEHEVSTLLLRMSGSLSSGEDEEEFLTREAAVMAELYRATYETNIESLRKWTDAYSAMIVSAGLIVVVSIISMMIYSLGPGMILMTGMVTMMIAIIGSWTIYLAAPKESYTRTAGLSAPNQMVAIKLFKYLVPAGFVLGLAAIAITQGQLGIGFIVLGLSLLPSGFLMNRDSKRLLRIDADIATATRMLGGVTDAIGTTVSDALSKIDRRSLGSLEPYFRRLEVRIRSGITPNRCWDHLIYETGSELIERTINIFWDALTIGGNPLITGKTAAFFAAEISVLREKRALVAQTFGYLTIPLHAAMVGLLVFIVNVMQLFASSMLLDTDTVDPSASGANIPDIANSSGFNTFANVNFEFLNLIIITVVVVFTIANAVAPWAASGGHRMRAGYQLGVMMIVSGLMLTLIPPASRMVFATISAPAT